MNRYPLWKNFLVVFVMVIGLVYAAPNLFPPDPAIQITVRESANEMTQAVVDKAVKALDEKGIVVKGSEFNVTTALLRLESSAKQLGGKAIVEQAVGINDYIVALNKAPNTPSWLAALGGEPMKLGLDLDGGVYFLLEVDIDAAVAKRMESTSASVRSLLREERTRYRTVEVDESNQVVAVFTSAELRSSARDLINDDFPDLIYSSADEGENFVLRMALSETAIQEIKDFALNQNRTTLNNRVNELGVAEARVAQQGANRLVVELPGVQDTAAAKRIIGRTANLEFRLEAKSNSLRSERVTFPMKEGGTAELESDIIFTGDNITNAQSGFDPQSSLPQVSITLDSYGGQRLNHYTKGNVGRRMGAVFIEFKENITFDNNGEQVVERSEEKEIINLSTVQDVLSYSFRITGLDNAREASELALLLRAGALAAPMYIVEDRTISASLGEKNIDAGIKSVYIGLASVLIFMLIYYRVFGFAANVALVANVVLLVAWMSLFGSVLTLPGIAGIVLTVGMAVDANVLIFSRIREELKEGTPPHQAINAGYDRAFTTILDANITTLIVAVVLFAIGSGPVKGFAVTLSLGIMTSMFTAIMGSRAIINWIYGRRRNLKKLWI